MWPPSALEGVSRQRIEGLRRHWPVEQIVLGLIANPPPEERRLFFGFHAGGAVPPLLPAPVLSAGGFRRPSADGDDRAGFRRQGDEAAGRGQPQLRVLPADQGGSAGKNDRRGSGRSVGFPASLSLHPDEPGERRCRPRRTGDPQLGKDGFLDSGGDEPRVPVADNL